MLELLMWLGIAFLLLILYGLKEALKDWIYWKQKRDFIPYNKWVKKNLTHRKHRLK